MNAGPELDAVPDVLDRAAGMDGPDARPVCNVVIADDGFDPGAVELSDDGFDPGAVDLSDDGFDPGAVDLSDDEYAGAGAGTVGRLAAAVHAVERTDAVLQYPDPSLVAAGPWLVLAPLSGDVSTVHCGTGRVTIRAPADPDPGVDRLLSGLLEAARPRHPAYPVEDDRQGVFTTGLTTYSLSTVDVEEKTVTVTFDVVTTPATRPEAVRTRFGAVDGVSAVAYEPLVGVERADPSPGLRDAVETAHRTVLDEACYEWVPEPTVFSRIPGPEKMALGTGAPGDRSFGPEAYARCVDLLVESIRATEVAP